MPFPDFLHPVIFQIGPFALRWYALAYVAGLLLGWRYAASLIKTPRLWGGQKPTATVEQIDDFMLWIALGVIGGGRIGYVLFYDTALLWTDPLEILKVWHGGMSFHGGMLGVTVATIIFALVNRIDIRRLGDLVAPVVPIGLFAGRIANFINGELWGRPTILPWGIVFPGAGPYPRHPSQLYEALLEGVCLFLILRWATHGKLWLQRRGVVAGLFLTFYALFRISLENVRQPDAFMPNFPLGLTMGMMLSAPMLIAGLILIAVGLREPIAAAKPAPAKPTDAAA